MTIFRI